MLEGLDDFVEREVGLGCEIELGFVVQLRQLGLGLELAVEQPFVRCVYFAFVADSFDLVGLVDPGYYFLPALEPELVASPFVAAFVVAVHAKY